MQLKTDFVRAQFPAFEAPRLKRWAHFENAGGSFICQPVIDILSEYHSALRVQPYAHYPASKRAGELMDRSYEIMAEVLNVAPSQIHFGPSTSANSYVLAQAIKPLIQSGQNIVVTNQDHEANTGAWRRMAVANGIEIREWGVDGDGLLDVARLWPLVDENTLLVAMPHASNIIGSINPVEAICTELRARGVRSIIDGVAYAPHSWPDLGVLGADAYFFSTYKTYGPHQGVMVLAKEFASKLENQSHYFNDAEARKRLNPAGPDHAQIAAIAGSGDYISALYAKFSPDQALLGQQARQVSAMQRDHETRLLETLFQGLATLENFKVIGHAGTRDRVPTVSLHNPKRSGAKLAKALRDYQIMASGGDFYAPRVLQAVGIDPNHGILRLSFVHYTKPREIEALIKALQKIDKA